MNFKPTKPTARELSDFAKTLGDLALVAAKQGDLPNTEKDELAKAGELLAKSVERLANVIAAHDALQLHNARCSKPCIDIGPFDPAGISTLYSALAGAFRLGGRAIENPIMEKIAREIQLTRAANARAKRSHNSRTIDAAIMALAKPLWTRDPKMKKSAGHIADKIADQLNSKLDKPLKKSAIEKRLRVLRRRTTG